MTMLKNVTSHSVESSPTTISSCAPTSATSTSPEGSSLLYEKANKGLGLVQDFMGQYNSYLQGSNSQVLNSNQTLNSLARGQTMYGDNGTMTQSMYGAYNSGLTATTLVVGVVLGCLMTLFVQKVGKGKTKS